MDTRNASFSTSGHGGGVPQRPAHSVWIHKNGSIKTNKEDTTSLSSRASTPRTGSHDFQALLRRDSFLETFDPSLLENRSGSFHSLFDLALGYTDENGGLDESAGGSSSERSHQVMRRMRYLTCVAAIGGFLSGYNTGVISGALLPLTRVFGMSPFQEESIVFATILFALASSMAGGLLNQFFGRRRTILSSAAIFTTGGLLMFCAQNYAMLVAGEVVLGIGIGLESITNPMYIAEVSKPEIRGMLVSAYAFMMVCGQFSAGVVDGVFGPFENGWRFMFGTAAVPGTVMFIGFLSLPESPAWLVANGQETEAKDVLKHFRDSDQDAVDECNDIKLSLRNSDDQQSPNIWQLFRTPSLRQALTVGCFLMFLQQMCGVNVIMYYSATIYQMSGFNEVTSLWLAAFTSLALLVGLFMSLFLVERIGRRPLVLASFGGVAFCLLGLGFAFYLARTTSEEVHPEISDVECMLKPALVWDGVTRYCYDCGMIEGCGFCGGACVKGGHNGPFADHASCPVKSEWQYDVCDTPTSVSHLPVVFMVIYLVAMGLGAAGLPWTINSEIYPVKYRSLAVGVSTGANWLCNLVISSTFLTISDASAMTMYGSFWMYAIVSFLGVGWLFFNLPETKGLSYEQIESCFLGESEKLVYDSRNKDETLPLQKAFPSDVSDTSSETTTYGSVVE
mmetsp:Transcript_356/g.712  ORF Transcript_356/g.712 Transcript_356/m.712 type:complete len:677 (+) Transcript_356:340-2370(+)